MTDTFHDRCPAREIGRSTASHQLSLSLQDFNFWFPTHIQCMHNTCTMEPLNVDFKMSPTSEDASCLTNHIDSGSDIDRY